MGFGCEVVSMDKQLRLCLSMSLRLHLILLSLGHYSARRLFICSTSGSCSSMLVFIKTTCPPPDVKHSNTRSCCADHCEHSAAHEGSLHTHLYDTLQMVHLCSRFHAGVGMPLRLCSQLLSMRLCLHVGLLMCYCLRLRDALDTPY